MLNCLNCSKDNLVLNLIVFLLFSALVKSHELKSIEETTIEDFLICRNCGNDVSLSNFLLSLQSPLAESAVNETVFNKKNILIQEIENPIGVRYKIIILKRATCSKLDLWSTTYSWFPGFAWKLCLCPQCSVHIGWMFEPIETAIKTQEYPSEKGFYALVINNIISETYVNSLLKRENFFN